MIRASATAIVEQLLLVYQQHPLGLLSLTMFCCVWPWRARKALVVMQENYRKDMTLKEAEVTALTTLKEVMEEKVGTESS